MFEGNTISLPKDPEVAQMHAATCLLMTRFINGHNNPRLAHLIVQQLSRLLSHPELEQSAACRDMYLQLMEHWQIVTNQLQKQKAVRQPAAATH